MGLCYRTLLWSALGIPAAEALPGFIQLPPKSSLSREHYSLEIGRNCRDPGSRVAISGLQAVFLNKSAWLSLRWSRNKAWEDPVEWLLWASFCSWTTWWSQPEREHWNKNASVYKGYQWLMISQASKAASFWGKEQTVFQDRGWKWNPMRSSRKWRKCNATTSA